MTFQEWFKEKYKDKPDSTEVNLITEYMKYHQYVHIEACDKAWDDFIMGA